MTSGILERPYIEKCEYCTNDITEMKYVFYKFTYDYIFKIHDEEICFEFFRFNTNPEFCTLLSNNGALYSLLKFYVNNYPINYSNECIIFFEKPKYKFSFKVLDDYYKTILFPLLEKGYVEQMKKEEHRTIKFEQQHKMKHSYNEEQQHKKEFLRLKDIEKKKKSNAKKILRLQKIKAKMEKHEEILDEFRDSQI